MVRDSIENAKMKLPRDSAGSMNLEGGTGEITGMIGLRHYLEVYKIDRTFRVQSPDANDPERKVPEMLWVGFEPLNVGSGNEIVARVFIQCVQALISLRNDKDEFYFKITDLLLSCRDDLVVAEQEYKSLDAEIAKIVRKIENGEIGMVNGSINPFPQVQNLQSRVTTFLVSIKRALQNTCRLFGLFWEFEITNPRFNRIIEFLEKEHPEQSGLLELLKSNHSNLVSILDLRNYQEHPNESKSTIVENFALSGQGITPPAWYVTGNQKTPIAEDMKDILETCINLSESMFFYNLTANVESRLPYEVVRLGQTDPRCPIRFRVKHVLKQNK